MRIPYAFILGMSHSGSTLLAFLLNAHPEIVSVGEVSRIGELLPARWQNGASLCSCGKGYFLCEFWNESLAGMALRGHGLGQPDFFKFEGREKREAQARLKAFAAAALAAGSGRVFLDASKHTQLVRPLAANRGLDLRVIDLYRDGRGIVNSWRKNQDAEPERLIRRWLRQENLRKHALKRIRRGRVHTVRYEALAQHPEETLQGILEFLGVDPSVRVTEGYKSRSPHHIIGNRMRLDGQEEIVFDERWRQELPQEWYETFEAMGAGKLNRSFGYPD
jgi:hypothetical protein